MRRLQQQQRHLARVIFGDLLRYGCPSPRSSVALGMNGSQAATMCLVFGIVVPVREQHEGHDDNNMAIGAMDATVLSIHSGYGFYFSCGRPRVVYFNIINGNSSTLAQRRRQQS